MHSVVLVGLMGVGKSTVGSHLARHFGVSLVDVDEVIVARTGMTVKELWETGGEAAFRELESQIVLDSLGGDDRVVIAAPAGVILDQAVRDAMSSAYVVWLRAAPTTLGDRAGRSDHRPLLGDDAAAVLARMADERHGLYTGVADLVIDTETAGPSAVADAIVANMTTVGP